MRTALGDQGSNPGQCVSVAEVMGVMQHEEMVGIRPRDVRRELEELQTEKSPATPAGKFRLDAQIADLRRQEAATAMEYDATHARSQTMQAALRAEQAPRPVSSGPRAQSSLDLESSPRLQRMEEAIEAIAIEVERIGEGQRFSTRLLSERLTDPIAKRTTPAESQGVRRAPGTITPH